MNNKIRIILISAGAIIIAIFLAWIILSPEKKSNIQNNRAAPDVAENKIAEEIKENIENIDELNQSEESELEEKKELVPITEKKSVDSPKKEEADGARIISRIVNFGFQQTSARKIDTVIIHSSYNSLGGDTYDVGAIIDIYEQYGVAAHYLIGRDGKIYRLVEDKNIAYHAGLSQVPDGRKNVNDFSIGIELVNTKTDKFTNDQYEALNDLLDQLKKDYNIKYVLGHDQIAPERKDDPWNFEWNKIK